MKKLTQLLFFCFISVVTIGQTLTIDTNDFIFYKDTSRIICNNQDTLEIDLNSDSIIDLRISLNNFSTYCNNGRWNENYTNKELRVRGTANCKLFIYKGQIFSNILVSKVQRAQTITLDANNQKVNARFYWEKMVVNHPSCHLFTLGSFEVSKNGYFVATIKNSTDTTHYLLNIKINQNYGCFQITNPSDTSILPITTAVSKNEINKTFNVYYAENNIFIQSANIITQLNVEIFNVLGKRVASHTINNSNEPINFSSQKNGVYFVRITDNSNQQIKSFKIMKL